MLTIIVPTAQPGRDHDPGRPGQAGREGHRRRRRRADHQVRRPSSSRTSPGSRATRPTSPAPTPPTSCPRKTTSGASSPRSSSARAMPASSTSPTPGRPTKVTTIAVPGRRECARDLRRRRRQGVRATRPRPRPFLDLARRPRRPGDPGRSRVPPAVVTERTARSRAERPCRRRRRRRPRSVPAVGRALAGLRRGLFGLFLALPVVTLVGRADPRRIARGHRVGQRRPRRPRLSLATTAVSLDRDGRPRRCRSRSSSLGAASAARACWRRSSTCRSSCRRRSPGLPCCWSSGAGACSASRSTSSASSIPFTTLAVVLAQTFVVGAVLHPLGADGHRGRRPRSRGRRPSRWRLGATALPVDHGAAGGVGPGGRPGDELGPRPRRIRGDDHVRRQRRGPDPDPAPRRLRASSRAATSTRSVAAAAILVLAAFGVLLAVRVLHWGRLLDVRGLS